MTTFQPASFLASSNIYAVNLRQYSEEGTFNAFAKHLPRLKDMGVEILWFMPIHPIGIKNRKGSLGSYYSIKDFTDVNPEYGDRNDFKNLVESAHAAGMKVILDWVANHAAWDNVWATSNPDFFERDEAGNFKAPYDWEDVIQINHSNEQEQQAMIDAMKYWVINFDIDGFRADLAHLTPLPFWINARTQLSVVKPSLTWLAETEDIPYHQAFDISFAWKWMHAAEAFCKGDQNLDSLLEVLQHYVNDFPKEAMRMYFTSNHDENSWCGTEYEKYGKWAEALAVFSCTWHGIPLVYTGQELPVKRRLHFFDKDAIEWTQFTGLHQFYKILLHLRKRNQALAAGLQSFPQFIHGVPCNKALAYVRRYADSAVMVFLNMTDEPLQFDFEGGEEGVVYKDVFTGATHAINQKGSVTLPAAGYLVLEK